jgi:hypothetical protein
MLNRLLTVLVGPYIFGIVFFYLSHYLIGAIVGAIAGKNPERHATLQATYMETVFMLKDVLALWAIGSLAFIMLGWI